MKRLIYQYLRDWAKEKDHCSLILRGARQVGKTHAIREFAKSFDYYIEANFEDMPALKNFFAYDLDAKRICEVLAARFQVPIISGKTLLFFDEIQECPQAIIALRYFYEQIPELHVIAAGSLLDFAIEKVGIPVGRVTFLHLYPLSFLEFIVAQGNKLLAKKLIEHTPDKPMPDILHEKLFFLLAEYMLIGGMPKAVNAWVEMRDLNKIQKILSDITNSYEQDFEKYAKKNQLKYVELIYKKVPTLISQAFKYSQIESSYQKRELAPALDLLAKGNILHKIYANNARGIPLGAGKNFEKFKLIMLDIALCQNLLGLNVNEWIYDPFTLFSNKGALCEALVGQEIIAYSSPVKKAELYYWHREQQGSQAEVDYIINRYEKIIPIEVKSGATGRLKSLRHFLEKTLNVDYGLRFSIQNYSIHAQIHSYPLYAVSHLFVNDIMREFCS
ncbi:MAG: hypothetical protein ACD_45C00673G0001 [uncultured bacterium]|nr:MAG: hypothetical protein ACD_45C00673G0001 [uncultured bacterium]